MRELPDQGVSEEIAEAQRLLSMWKSVTTKPMTTREVEFAKLVRKQAYEDGLRDAAVCTDSVGHRWSGAPAHAFFELADSFRAMITASQEKK